MRVGNVCPGAAMYYCGEGRVGVLYMRMAWRVFRRGLRSGST